MTVRLPFRAAGTSVGIDVGSHAVKLVRLERRPRGFVVAAAEIAEYRSDFPEEEELLDTLGELTRRCGLGKAAANLVLPGRDALVRYFVFPKMPDEELRQAVLWESAKHTSHPPDELVADHVVLNRAPAGGEKQLQVMAVFAPRALVERWVGHVERLGFRIVAVDIPAMALLAYRDQTDSWETPGSLALLDLGHSKTGIHLFRDRQLVFTRDIAVGGRDVSQAVGDALQVDQGQAAALKERLGLDGSGEEAEKVRQVVEQVLERITVEVQRSFDYHQAQAREAAPAVVELTGGTSRLPGIVGFFSRALQLQVRLDEPGGRGALTVGPAVTGGAPALGPAYSAGIGAATRRSPR